jgi:putative aldouronate transport system permease protein
MLKSFFQEMRRDRWVYLILLPGLAYYVVFHYGPIYGVQLAFKDYWANKGFWGSPWNNFQSFKFMAIDHDFWRAVRNTMMISSMAIVVCTPFPIILAILISEFRDGPYKRVLQTVFTFPHFISWVVISSLVFNLLSANGAINTILGMMGLKGRQWLADPVLFRPLMYILSIMKESGWTSIIYLATIAGINPELFDAAEVDGCSRARKVFHITIPELLPTIAVLVILAVGRIMDYNFDQIFNLYNPVVYPVADIIDTFIYRVSFPEIFLTSADFSFTTAVGLFKSVINLALMLGANRAIRAMGQPGLV